MPVSESDQTNTFENHWRVALAPWLNGRDLQTDWHLVRDLGMDSLSCLHFYMDLEDAFQVEIPDARMEDLCSTSRLHDYLLQKTQASTSTKRNSYDQ